MLVQQPPALLWCRSASWRRRHPRTRGDTAGHRNEYHTVNGATSTRPLPFTTEFLSGG